MKEEFNLKKYIFSIINSNNTKEFFISKKTLDTFKVELGSFKMSIPTYIKLVKDNYNTEEAFLQSNLLTNNSFNISLKEIVTKIIKN